MTLFLLLDYIGTLVFAISGGLAAMNKKFDPFGVVIIALVTAVGGGSLRDILIGRTPVAWMMQIEYFLLVLAGAFVAILFRERLVYFRRTLFLFDAIGLGIFTITGVEIGLRADLHPAICLVLGTLSAAFGGVIRDILVNEVPLIFHKEVYASLSLLGGILLLAFHYLGWSLPLGYVLISSFIVLLRILAVRYHWSLPRFYKEV
jgi:uncharacterized membrane protein YeiH